MAAYLRVSVGLRLTRSAHACRAPLAARKYAASYTRFSVRKHSAPLYVIEGSLLTQYRRFFDRLLVEMESSTR